MGNTVRKIEVDGLTAATLETRAAEQGISVADLVADLTRAALEPATLPAEEIAELDRRWQAAKEGGTIPHEQVVQWLGTWGTPNFRPWRSS
jgi:predicted transcriptional regulator